MYVSPEARGHGVGRAVLAALQTEARALGLARLVLETGIRQPEAIALYERAGFSRIPAFGEYVNSPVSVCMAKDLAPRPFYGEFAWAYDYLVARPVAEECAGMAATLGRRGIGAGATLLDAGCGTGRYAVELARRGFVVTGVDRSPAPLEEAVARARGARGDLRVRFERADLLALAAESAYDVAVCRGVLNDLIDADGRSAVFGVFARAPVGRGDAARRPRLGRDGRAEDGGARDGEAGGDPARAARVPERIAARCGHPSPARVRAPHAHDPVRRDDRHVRVRDEVLDPGGAGRGPARPASDR